MSQTWLGGATSGEPGYTAQGLDNIEVCFKNVWDSQRAVFRPCFLPVISAIPAILATVLLVLQILSLLLRWRPEWTLQFVVEHAEMTADDEPKHKSKRSSLSILLILLVAAGFFVTLADAVDIWPDLGGVFTLVAWLIALGMLFVYPSSNPSFSVLSVLVLLTIANSIVLSSLYRTLSPNAIGLGTASLILSICSIISILAMPLRDPGLPTEEISEPFTTPTASLRSPEDNLTLWQFMTVRWMIPLINLGYTRQLQDDDVWQLAYEFQHRRLHDSFRRLKGTVIRRLVRANIIDLYIMAVLSLIETTSNFATPVLLQQLLAAMEDPLKPKRAAVVYAGLTLAASLVATQVGVFNLWFGRRCYERSRGEMITMLYEKTLGRKIAFEEKTTKDEKDDNANRNSNGHTNGNANGYAHADSDNKKQQSLWRRTLASVTSVFGSWKSQPKSKAPANMGKILNLMRNDVYEVAQRFWEFQELIRLPLSAVFSITLTIRFLGWPALFSVALLLLAQAISAIISRIMVYYGKKRRVVTDTKLQFITQFVEAIRHLRWYGWQGHWLKQILEAREKELYIRVIINIWAILMSLVQSLSLDLAPVVAFFAYTVIADKKLTVDIAFPAMQLFSMINQALRNLPNLITVIIDAWVAVGRIEDFMAEPDREEMATEALIGDSVAVEHGSFAWPGLSDPVLKNITLSFPPGLHVICGEVASGKTALLQALLGELDMFDGQLIRPQEPIAYCAQTPWLQSMSIRENILFSAPYEEDRYKKVLSACALIADLAEFKAGDQSMIGENGIGLSGGQKARVALARAIYSRTKILLLDDPLSALDQQTAEAIAKNCLAGPLMEGRIAVLITHRTDLVLDYATQFIRMENGTATVIDREAIADDTLQRIASTKSKETSTEEQAENDQKADAVPDKFEEDEHRRHGGVQLQVYWAYIKAGKIRWWIVLIVAAVLYRADSVAAAYVLRAWGEAYNTATGFLALAMSKYDIHTVNHPKWPFDQWPTPDEDVKPWLILFSIFTLLETVTYGLLRTVLVVIALVAARRLFKDIIDKVAHATFRYYDVTPVGRLMNRMTSDIGVIDGGIAVQLQSVTSQSISWLTALIVIASVTPVFLVFSAVLVVAFVYVFILFLPTSQSLRRLEMVSLTPLMSNFGALLNGLATVRAFRAQDRFQDRVIAVVDNFQKMDHFYWSLQAWLMYRYDVLSDVSTFLITMLALATNLSPGWTAFALLYANKFVGNTHALCKQYGQLQMEFVSVERVVELIHIEQEPEGTVKPPAWWPSFTGDITFEKVSIKYAPHLDPALDGVSFTVKGGSKTAVIGRTGSGKSTLALAMLATILPNEGTITIDNINLAEVDKQLLRTRVTFLAQDPVLFPGTMRQNLDPIGEHTDEACTAVLLRVCERQGWSLETNIEAGGKNLSQGQRQLVGLARAVLRRSAIIILDEATASIDRETAMQIQQVMHEEMKDSTVITIAHRLEAVRKADYCIVLGKGKILRQGPAEEMLREHRGEMVDENEDTT